jgi:hypothetical protein
MAMCELKMRAILRGPSAAESRTKGWIGSAPGSPIPPPARKLGMPDHQAAALLADAEPSN